MKYHKLVEQTLDEDLKSTFAKSLLGLSLLGTPKAAEAAEAVYKQYSGPKNSMVINDASQSVKQHEGLRTKVYKDSVGIPSIGYGYNLKRSFADSELNQVGSSLEAVMNGNPLTLEQINKLFEKDLQRSILIAKKFIPNLDQQPDNIQVVLIDMAYNLGNRLFEFKKLQSAIQQKDYKRAGAEMKNSNWYHQVRLRGRNLVNLVLSTIN